MQKVRSGIVDGLFCLVCYVVVGLVVSGFHTRLAGGETIHGVFTAILMPFVVAGVHFSYLKWYGDWWQCHVRGAWIWGVLCILLVAVTFLPVILNFGAIIARDFGHFELGGVLFEYRYKVVAWGVLGLLLIDPVHTIMSLR